MKLTCIAYFSEVHSWLFNQLLERISDFTNSTRLCSYPRENKQSVERYWIGKLNISALITETISHSFWKNSSALLLQRFAMNWMTHQTLEVTQVTFRLAPWKKKQNSRANKFKRSVSFWLFETQLNAQYFSLKIQKQKLPQRWLLDSSTKTKTRKTQEKKKTRNKDQIISVQAKYTSAPF